MQINRKGKVKSDHFGVTPGVEVVKFNLENDRVAEAYKRLTERAKAAKSSVGEVVGQLCVHSLAQDSQGRHTVNVELSERAYRMLQAHRLINGYDNVEDAARYAIGNEVHCMVTQIEEKETRECFEMYTDGEEETTEEAE